MIGTSYSRDCGESEFSFKSLMAGTTKTLESQRAYFSGNLIVLKDKTLMISAKVEYLSTRLAIDINF